MNERDIWWKIVLVAVLTALALAAVNPIGDKIKWGIDLAGGYSLMYELDNTGMEGTDRTELPRRVIEVLQRRVDPRGVFNLVWRPVGTNRIEIQMPAPPEGELGPRKELEDYQDQLRGTLLRRNQIVAAISRTPEDRPAAFKNMSAGIEGREALLEAAAKAYDALKETQAEYDARSAEAKTKNLTRDDIANWLKQPAEQRDAGIDAIARDVPTRKALLEAVARAWDELEAAKAQNEAAKAANPTATQPAVDVTELDRTYLRAVANVLSTNINIETQTTGVNINTVVDKEEALDTAIGDVLATNVDVGRLQVLLEMAPDGPGRQEGLDKMIAAHPAMADVIEGIIKASDALHTNKSGEGRLDPADLQRLLRGAGVLEFRILPKRTAENPFKEFRDILAQRGPRASLGEDYAWFEIEDPTDFLKVPLDQLQRSFEAIRDSSIHVIDRFGDKYYVLADIAPDATMIHGKTDTKDWSLKSARFTRDESGRPAIGFTLDEVGGIRFRRLTTQYRGEQLCIFLDDRAISSANINSPIGTNGIIQGNFTPDEVNEMVKKLNAGSLPQKLKEPPISVRAIGPTLGKANRTAGLTAAVWGGGLVAVFMLFYYLYAGGIAVIAVAINILLIGAMMATLGATMTLPGIAGLVLAIGMAVDANVLINERIREETAKGTALRMAIKLGYERAFRAILDSNITTILTCVILYMVGSEQVKGFGLTLGVGVFINIFTAYFVTRLFFEFMSMISIPREVVRFPFYTAAAIAGVGLAFIGLAYLMNKPETLNDSVARGFGFALLIDVAPAIVIAMGLMYVFRAMHHGKKELPMMKFIGVPKFDWVAKRHVFYGISGALILTGAVAGFSLKPDQIMDIEFLGGTSAQFELVKGNTFDASADIPGQITKRLDTAAQHLDAFADQMKSAKVSESDGVVTINSGVPAIRLEPVILDELGDELSEAEPFRYVDAGSGEVTLFLRNNVSLSGADITKRLSERLRRAALAITGAQVQTNSAFEGAEDAGLSYTVVTRETSKEIVVAAILDQMEDDLEIKPALAFTMVLDPESKSPYFPIFQTDPRALGIQLSDEAAASIDLTRWQGGVAIVLDNVEPPQPLSKLRDRLKAMRMQPGFEQFGWRESDAFGLERARVAGKGDAEAYSKVLVVVADENITLSAGDEGEAMSIWQSNLAEPEVELIQAALQRQQSLEQVTQFDNQVSGESQIQAGLALALSWLLIIVFVWIRFGNVRWGLAAVSALVHDVLIALSFVAFTYYIAQNMPALGKLLMIDKVFRIDLPMVAALLTVVGYSVNDTIIVFDRIRENRGRQSEVSVDMVNESINQTLSRTVLTLLTSIITVFVMYIFGGEGIHSFNYVLLVGLLIGTYSSVGIASQFLLRRALLKKD
ncbi:MAG: protein translocase subunit SecD [Phycisphaerales bacterium]|nr:protein translocase subunit SecD [Phycisphaerales bacterium]MCB9858695.1 protein translocase subunit SecD [Phycisphaerales bacterium]MCB9864449.1 protein translocase subunit SecD [Phycisphaerales bacterium]